MELRFISKLHEDWTCRVPTMYVLCANELLAQKHPRTWRAWFALRVSCPLTHGFLASIFPMESGQAPRRAWTRPRLLSRPFSPQISPWGCGHRASLRPRGWQTLSSCQLGFVGMVNIVTRGKSNINVTTRMSSRRYYLLFLRPVRRRSDWSRWSTGPRAHARL